MATKKRRPEVGVRELKNRTSEILAEVREHEIEYVVTKHDRPVAVVRPYRADDDHDSRIRAQQILARVEKIALRVAAVAGPRSAAAAVARQRR